MTAQRRSQAAKPGLFLSAPDQPTMLRFARSMRTFLLGTLALLAAWLALLAGVALLRSDARTIAVLGPPAHGLRVLAATDQPVVDFGPWAVTTRTSSPDAVRRLYAAGAWLVIEGSAGCGWIKPRRSDAASTATSVTERAAVLASHALDSPGRIGQASAVQP
jgi:hypothetical protein